MSNRIDLDQARRRAKELLEAARAGDADAIARLPRRHDPIVLADAQLAIARELGFPSWPKLVASVGWKKATYDDVDWARVQRLTIVPFLDEDDVVVIPEDGLPSDELRPGEWALREAVLRIALEQAGYRPQGTHVFALGEGGTHVAVWTDGDRYAGTRPHRRDSHWWTGAAATVDDELVRMADEHRSSITHEVRVADGLRILEPLYLGGATLQEGSGFRGPIEDWNANHAHIAAAIEADGTFLDVGCANGFLMECVVAWCADRGVQVEPFGMDISAAFVEHTKERLPQWADNVWVGDALTWRAPRTFDVVHALTDTVTPSLRRELVDNVMTYVSPGGRLVLSHYRHSGSARKAIEPLGYEIEDEVGLGVYLRKPE